MIRSGFDTSTGLHWYGHDSFLEYLELRGAHQYVFKDPASLAMPRDQPAWVNVYYEDKFPPLLRVEVPYDSMDDGVEVAAAVLWLRVLGGLCR